MEVGAAGRGRGYPRKRGSAGRGILRQEVRPVLISGPVKLPADHSAFSADTDDATSSHSGYSVYSGSTISETDDINFQRFSDPPIQPCTAVQSAGSDSSVSNICSLISSASIQSCGGKNIIAADPSQSATTDKKASNLDDEELKEVEDKLSEVLSGFPAPCRRGTGRAIFRQDPRQVVASDISLAGQTVAEICPTSRSGISKYPYASMGIEGTDESDSSSTTSLSYASKARNLSTSISEQSDSDSTIRFDDRSRSASDKSSFNSDDEVRKEKKYQVPEENWMNTYGLKSWHKYSEGDSEEVKALLAMYPFHCYANPIGLDDEVGCTTTKERSRPTKSNSSKSSGSRVSRSTSESDSSSVVSFESYGSSRSRKADPVKLRKATETLKRSIPKWSISRINLRLTFQEVEDSDEGCAFFSLDGNENDILRCRINVENSLKRTNWWKQNKKLLLGRDYLLQRTFYDYIQIHIAGEIVVAQEKMVSEIALDGIYNMTVDIVNTDEEIERFETLLLKNSKPGLEDGEMKKGFMISLKYNASVLVGLDDTFFPTLMSYLRTPFSENAIENREPMEVKAFKAFYKLFKVKHFLATLGTNTGQLYRIEILERLSESELEVLYIDLGIQANIQWDQIAMMTMMSELPPLLSKIPPQVIKFRLHELTEVDYPFVRSFNMDGQTLMVKSVNDAKREIPVTDLSLETEFNLQEAPKREEIPKHVVIFRCATKDENCRDILSLNQYLRIVENLNFQLAPNRTTGKVEKAVHTLWQLFQNEKDSLAFVDKLYEQYFLKTTGTSGIILDD